MKCSCEDTFGVLFDKLDIPETIDKVQISTNEKFTDPVHVVPIDVVFVLIIIHKIINLIHTFFLFPATLVNIGNQPVSEAIWCGQNNVA